MICTPASLTCLFLFEFVFLMVIWPKTVIKMNMLYLTNMILLFHVAVPQYMDAYGRCPTTILGTRVWVKWELYVKVIEYDVTIG